MLARFLLLGTGGLALSVPAAAQVVPVADPSGKTASVAAPDDAARSDIVV